MTKSLKVLITIIGALSIISGLYLANKGATFSEYFSGIFIGISLIGTVLFYKAKRDSSE